jgi:hypothetical protein
MGWAWARKSVTQARPMAHQTHIEAMHHPNNPSFYLLLAMPKLTLLESI